EDGSSGGTIYSLRGLTIGGMPTRTKAWYTAEGVNVNGWVCDAFIEDDDSPSYISEYTMHIRYSQIIYNTDIVLETPNGAATPRKSAFKPALNYRNAWYRNANNTGDAYKTRREMLARYKPKTKIIGGHVYVGSGQTLTIYGGKQLYLNPGGLPAVSNDKPTGEYNMEVRPDSMTIATGASVSIETSENTNVDTEIYVSGSLKLKAGSNVKGTIFVEKEGSLVMDGGGTFTGDIYVKNGGTINIGGGTVINGDVYCAGKMMITGSITVNHPAVMENDPITEADESQPALHGIYIMHSPVTGNGSLTLAGTGMVSGSSGKIHSIAGYPSITGAPAEAVFCDNKDESNNACEHWKTEIGSWQKQVSANG
ncbi:MAG: hypothetical protein LBG82_05535, partial [Clostridiales Family XIII bacterium]|nr:hypothetical protein [Clostridiales Family XIII bacterium]